MTRKGPALFLSVLVLLLCSLPSFGFRIGSRFLLVSSPSKSAIYYGVLPGFEERARALEDRQAVAASLLINGNSSKCSGSGCDENSDFGLQEPSGLAIYEGSHLSSAVLYVADLKAENIYAYTIRRLATNTLIAGSQIKVLRNVKALGLAADSLGNLLYTASSGEVGLLAVKDLQACIDSGTEITPTILYGGSSSSSSSSSLSGPAGIATDSFFLYIANSGGSSATGSVLKAPEILPSEAEAISNGTINSTVTLGLQSIASNTDANVAVALNLCLARDNIFYTGDTTSLFAVKLGGGSIAEVVTGLKQPRGCAFDEEGTLYVADETANSIFSLPASFATLQTFNKTAPVFSVPGPSGLAVFATRSTSFRSGASDCFSPLSLIFALAIVCFHQLF